jgi:hypothetical protein
MAINRTLPTRNVDGSTIVTPSRTGPYMEAYNIQVGASNWVPADEGSYFVAQNPTVGTGIAGHAAPVVADTDTKALLHIYNSGVKNIVLDYIWLEVTAAGTGGTITYAVGYLDAKGSTARSSAGTLCTPVCTGPAANTSAAVAYFGPVVTAMTSSRCIAIQLLREIIPVVQDTALIKFGSPNGGVHSGLTTAGTATCHIVNHFPPVVIGPGGNFNFASISPSQSAARSYQFSVGFWER